jgi:hypothetical protein
MTARPRRKLARRLRRQRRRGYALVIFALVFFCLMALGALVIDLGLARMTQRQMQTAADTAALEGLRGRDAAGTNADVTRRENAARFADLVFDQDNVLDGTNATDQRWQDLEAAKSNPELDERFLDLAQDSAYNRAGLSDLPGLQTNEENLPTGDMAAGRFLPDSTDRPPFDFGVGDSAFLVQMRRTGEPSTDVSSIGARMPLLFGRGSLVSRQLAGTQVERGPGIAVRATAIAEGQPARSAGRSIPVEGIIGIAAFSITQDAWMGNENGSEPAIFSPGLGVNLRIQQANPTIVETAETSPRSVGVVFEPNGEGRLVAFGENLAPASPTNSSTFMSQVFSSAPVEQQMVIVPIVSSNAQATNRVIGFGWTDVALTAQDQLSVTKRQSRIAPHNASVAIAQELDVDDAMLTIMLSDHRRLNLPEVENDSATINALLAPALVR